MQLQLRWKQDQNRKQKESRISWRVWGQNQSGPIKSHPPISKQSAVPPALWRFTDEAGTGGGGGEQENHRGIKHTSDEMSCLVNPCSRLRGHPSACAVAAASTSGSAPKLTPSVSAQHHDKSIEAEADSSFYAI